MTMFDSHCHLNDEQLLLRVEEEISSAKKEGVKAMIVIGWDLPSSKKAVELAHRYEGIYAAVGFHPENLDDVSDDALKEIEELAHDAKVVAIGEIGLDYHWFKEESHRSKQKEWFIKQIDLANKVGLPISIHGREASGDILEILKAHTPIHSGVLHCYSGSVETMRELEKLGMYFGFDGPITYKNAVTPKECVKECPIDRLLVETDSPYLPPVPHRGETNSPKYIPLIVRAMAELKGVYETLLRQKLWNNFERLFRVKHHED